MDFFRAYRYLHGSFHDKERIETAERVDAVHRAIKQAKFYMPGAIRDVTGYDLGLLMDSVIPGLLGYLGVLFVASLGGGIAGSMLGSVALGAGAGPGFVMGATVGLKAGVSVLNYLGLAFLVSHIGGSIYEATFLARIAIREAWKSPDDQWPQSAVRRAAQKLAQAGAHVINGILQGIAAFLVARGTRQAASRVSELTSNLRASKLGSGFANWVEANWKTIIESPRFKAPTESPKQWGGGGFPEEPPAVSFSKLQEGNFSRKTISSSKFSLNRKRKKMAIAWYKQHGMSQVKAIKRAAGLDFSEPIEQVNLQPGLRLEQWVIKGRKPGIDFTKPGTDPKTLGIITKGRTKMVFEVTEKIRALRGTARNFPIGKIPHVGGPGGGPQLSLPPDWQRKVLLIKTP